MLMKNLFLFLLLLNLVSCIDTKKVVYFNDIGNKAVIQSLAGIESVISPNDMLSINVSSRDLQATAIFNAPNLPMTPSGAPATSMAQASGYLVSSEGTINFPLLGVLKISGKTKSQVENEIASKLIESKLLFDPIVNVRYLNYRVTILGEVARPGVVQIPSEQVNILEAIGLAGDLTIYGKRNNILLIRQVGPQKILERLDLSSTKLFESPFFYLKSNDIIYVEPEKAKVASGTRGQQLLPYIISGVSILALVLTNIFR